MRARPNNRGMSQVQRVGDLPAERLSWDEICARYPGEWVCLVEADWIDEDHIEFGTAVVAGHGPNRRDPLDQTRHLLSRYNEMVHEFTGPIRPARPLYMR